VPPFVAAPTTVVTTIAITTTTTTTNPIATLPPLDVYLDTYHFSGSLVTDDCGVATEPDDLTATLDLTFHDSTTVGGMLTVFNGDKPLFTRRTLGRRPPPDPAPQLGWPTWGTTSLSFCVVSVPGQRCARVWTNMVGRPDSDFQDPAGQAPGAVWFVWNNPDCTARWEGSWQ
jgi:hypothetical protein